MWYEYLIIKVVARSELRPRVQKKLKIINIKKATVLKLSSNKHTYKQTSVSEASCHLRLPIIFSPGLGIAVNGSKSNITSSTKYTKAKYSKKYFPSGAQIVFLMRLTFTFLYIFIRVVTAVVFSLTHPRYRYTLPVRASELFGRTHGWNKK